MSQMFLNVVSTFKGDGLAAATRQLGAFGKQAGGLGGTLGKVGAALASFGLAAKSVEFAKSSIDSARDLERNLFSVNTIFGDLAPRMIRFSKDAENIGLSQKDAAKAVTFLGSVLKQSGFEMEDVVTESEKLVSLGVDLAATYGYDVQEALLGMTALFRGEYDPIEKFGVAMKQAEINAELQARGLHKLTGAALRNAEQTIRMELLYERAADASGAFTAQTGNLFVEQKKLSAQFENMQATVGTALLPAMGELVATLVPLVDDLMPRLVQVVKDAAPALEAMVGFLKDASDESTETGATISFLADVLGGTFRIIAENFTVLVQLTALFLGARLAIFGVTTALTLLQAHPVIAAITLLAAGFILINDAAKNTQFAVDKSGAAVTSFNTAINQSVKNGKYVTDKYGEFKVVITEASDEAVRLGKEVANADKAKLDNLKASILGVKISAGEAANEVARMYRQAGMTPPGATGSVIETETGTGTGTAAGSVKQATDVLRDFDRAQVLGKKAFERQQTLLSRGLDRGLVDSIMGQAKPIKLANKIINETLRKDGNVKIKAVKSRNAAFAATIGEQNRMASEAASAASAASAAAAQAAEELRRAEQARLEEQARVYQSFLDTVKGTFAGIKNAIMGAFDITGLGGSTNAIMRNMDKLLVRLRSFSANVKQLATMGLDPALLQQVITMGPMAGARLATALVQGGAGALGAINAGFGEFGSLAGDIARTGTESLFNRDAQKTEFTINVSGGVGSGATIGKAIVDAIADYERTSGAVWTRA